ncbi:MAG: hemolysin III family protein [Oscillospiraceae bacterium]|nr:hemolysin III family protein [Oscillospiraceae bacterium]
MIKRVKLQDRVLPDYCLGEEITNTVTHILGGLGGVAALTLCLSKAIAVHGPIEITASVIYGCCLIILYSISSIYHGLKPSMAKKVMQVLDHCAIYFLIAGSYSIITLGAIRRAAPALGWGMFAVEWVLCTIATVLTAIDLKRYEAFSMVCYIGMGWAIFPFIGQIHSILGSTGFWLLLGGGIAYSVGAVLYGIGSKVRWMHSVFHVFVVLGSVLHFFAFYWYGM